MFQSHHSRSRSHSFSGLLTRSRLGKLRFTLLILALALFLIPSISLVSAWTASNEVPQLKTEALPQAQLSSRRSVRIAGSANPTVKLYEGRDMLTAYRGADELRQLLEENQAQPLALASGDFDEDGTPDLVGGYAGARRGIITLYRGNVDAVYPQSAEAQQRRTDGTFTESPFLAPGGVFEVTGAPDFLGAGDFNGDGHYDLVTASRGSHILYLLPGDGRGGFGPAQEVRLTGGVTALVVGEINRADGLLDVVIGIAGDNGAQLLVFEGPEGALRAQPEVFQLQTPAVSLALGQLDNDYEMDLAVAAGQELLLLHGRDRKLSIDEAQQRAVGPANIEERRFAAPLTAVVVGDFSADHRQDIALLNAGGDIEVLSRGKAQSSDRQAIQAISTWRSETVVSNQWAQANLLLSARVSGRPGDDLLVMDSSNQQLHILIEGRASSGNVKTNAISDAKQSASSSVTLSVASAPQAALAMRLDEDALSDLVILRSGVSAPTFALTNQSSADAIDVSSQSATAIQSNKPAEKGVLSAPTRFDGATPVDQTSRDAIQQSPKSGSKETAAMREQSSQQLACVTGNINIGQTLNGVLDSSDCILGDGSYYDRYTFSGTAGQQVVIFMASSSFDTYLQFYAPGGAFITSDDDGGGGTNSRIPSASGFYTLPSTGTYTIYANALYPGATGSYSLSLTGQSSGGGTCPPLILNGGQSFNASLATTDCFFNSGDRNGAYVDVYGFNGTAGQQVAISMSAVFDTYLYLLGPGNTTVASNDDIAPGSNTNSRIPVTGFFTLPTTGQYVIYATSFSPSVTGSYSFSLSFAAGSTVVTNTNDSGAGSLRQAIFNANTNTGADIITFNIAGTGIKTINLLSALPTITDAVTINGQSQPGFAGSPLIELNGTSAGAGVDGLKITAGSSVVRGLIINRFGGSGIVLSTFDFNVIEGNYIGTNATGTAALGNLRFGIDIYDSWNNTIGGTTAAARNIVSGNGFSGTGHSGIRLSNDPHGNQLRGNYIGTDVNGNLDLGNRLNGVYLYTGVNNVVGGTLAGARNIISGNDLPGVALSYTGPEGNLVQGNYIGTNAAGNAALANNEGLIIGGFNVGGDCNGCPNTAINNTVGGTTVAARNVISGNFSHGVEVINLGSTGNLIQGNYIGTNAAGTAALKNTHSGVFITRAPDNTIGGTTSSASNVISGNQVYGVGIGIPKTDPVSGITITGGTGVKVLRNFIGTDLSATLAIGNGSCGVFVDADSVTNTIEGNVIAHNGNNGVCIPNNSNPGVKISIDSNLIYNNIGMGIDLGPAGPTNNDAGDVDNGANDLQNYPLDPLDVTLAARSNKGGDPSIASTGSVTITDTFKSAPSTEFVLRFYFGSSCSGSTKQFTGVATKVFDVGTKRVITDVNGNASYTIDVTLPESFTSGFINGTATSVSGARSGNTSEFSPCFPVNSTGTTPTPTPTPPPHRRPHHRQRRRPLHPGLRLRARGGRRP